MSREIRRRLTVTPALRSSSEPPSFTVPSWSRRIPESSLSSVAALSVVVVPSSESSDAVVPEPSAESVASLAVMSTESTLAGASSSEARSRSAARKPPTARASKNTTAAVALAAEPITGRWSKEPVARIGSCEPRAVTDNEYRFASRSLGLARTRSLAVLMSPGATSRCVGRQRSRRVSAAPSRCRDTCSDERLVTTMLVFARTRPRTTPGAKATSTPSSGRIVRVRRLGRYDSPVEVSTRRTMARWRPCDAETGTVNEMLPLQDWFGGSSGIGPIGATQPSGSPMTSNVGCATVDPVFTMSTRTCAGVSGEARISLLYNRVVITASGFWRAASVVYVYRDFRPWALVAAKSPSAATSAACS